MNYQAFTIDSLTMMYQGARGALAVDDAFSELGKECRFRVRETPEWKMHAADLEAEMLRRGMIFEVIDWSEDLFSFRRPPPQNPDRNVQARKHSGQTAENFCVTQGHKPEKAVLQSIDRGRGLSSEIVKEHVILGANNQDAERQRGIWLAENPAIKVLRVHQPKREPHTLLTRLGGRNVPRFSITVEYGEADVTKECISSRPAPPSEENYRDRNEWSSY
jgi:hypothetical protein